MKILHIIDSLGLGGAQTVLKGIFEAQKDNKDIFLFALRKFEPHIVIDHPNVFIYENNARFSFAPLFVLRKFIKQEKIEIIHCHLFRSQVFGWLLKLFSFSKIKLIFHEHGQIYGHEVALPLEDLIFRKFLYIAKFTVDSFIAVSKSCEQKLVSRANIPLSKIIVLNNFVDLRRFDSVKRNKTKIFTISYVGRLSKVKGCEFLIRALPFLNFPYKVLIAGSGELFEKLESLAKDLNVYQNIEFLGFVKETEKIYENSDIYVMPSLSEASPMSFCEAQAYGIPVLGSDVASINEFIVHQKNGFLFKVKDSKLLAEQITHLYNNPKDVEKMFQYSIENVNQYSLDLYLKKLTSIYKNI
ncbi:MAG: glycosyltransferase family 1 protein [Bacteroidetes bacterium]|nr:MAG: glycosyltransferase family 1 protein [Bacteroidota bacterium]